MVLDLGSYFTPLPRVCNSTESCAKFLSGIPLTSRLHKRLPPTFIPSSPRNIQLCDHLGLSSVECRKMMSGPIPALSASRKRQRTVPTDKSRPAYPRKRAAQACCTCRKRRTKCDNEQPACGSCVGLRIECFYDEKDKST